MSIKLGQMYLSSALSKLIFRLVILVFIIQAPTNTADSLHHRKTVDTTSKPWRSIGSISIAGRQFCTGTLVSRALVLTAAHCIWNSDRHGCYKPEHINFLAGYSQGRYLAHSIATEYFHGAKFVYQNMSPSVLSNDWALIKLATPLGQHLGYLELLNEEALPSVNSFIITGYSEDNRETLSIIEKCGLQEDVQEKLYRSQCRTNKGDSGAPILVRAKTDIDEYKVVAISIAKSDNTTSLENSRSIAIPVSNLREIIRELDN